MAYRIRQGRHFNVPKPGLDYTETFLYLLDHLGEEDYKPNPVIAKALDVLFILHADHEMVSLSFVIIWGTFPTSVGLRHAYGWTMMLMLIIHSNFFCGRTAPLQVYFKLEVHLLILIRLLRLVAPVSAVSFAKGKAKQHQRIGADLTLTLSHVHIALYGPLHGGANEGMLLCHRWPTQCHQNRPTANTACH